MVDPDPTLTPFDASLPGEWDYDVLQDMWRMVLYVGINEGPSKSFSWTPIQDKVYTVSEVAFSFELYLSPTPYDHPDSIEEAYKIHLYHAEQLVDQFEIIGAAPKLITWNEGFTVHTAGGYTLSSSYAPEDDLPF